MAILYVAAEKAELQVLANALVNLRNLKWPLDYAQEGILAGKRIMLAANGAGPRLASQAVEVAIRAVSAAELSSSRLEAVVSVGYCGGLDPALKLYQVVLASGVITSADENVTPCEIISDPPAGVVIGCVFSQDRIATTVEEKRKLSHSGAIAVEMEFAGVIARAKRAGLPCYCIKVVSDEAGEAFGLDLNTLRTIDGRIARGKIVLSSVSGLSLIR